jgi:hypothetical protein
MGIAEDLADKLAADVIDYVERTGDEALITLMGQTLGDSSQTLQEAFVTSVRVQRAAIRAQRMLAERLALHEGRPPPAPPEIEAPAAAHPAPWDEEPETASDGAPEPEATTADPASEEEATESAEPEADDSMTRPEPTPGRPSPPKRKPPVPTVGGGRPKFG